MTEKEFEIRLKERITIALETEQENFAQENWENFEKKFSDYQNRKRLTSLLRIAATILLFVVSGISVVLIYNENGTNTNQTALRNNFPQQRKEESIIQKDEKENLVLPQENEQNSVGKNLAAREANAKGNVQRSKSQLTKTSIRNSENTIPPQKDSQTEYKAAIENTIGANTNISSQSNIRNADTLKNPEQVNGFVKQNVPINTHELEYPYQIDNYSKSIFRIGANVSSIVNYDQANNNSKLHMGFGIFVEIPLLEDLVVYSGVLFTNQSINFQSVTEQSIAIGKHVKSKDLLLMGFDIPINLKYRFDFAKTRFFVSTGVSSLTFLKENIETTYDVRSTVSTIAGGGITIFQTVSKEEMETKSLGSFNDFFFAKILNVSFGLELPLNSKNILLIEPYFKYSIGPLKSVEAYPSILGINLGIMF